MEGVGVLRKLLSQFVVFLLSLRLFAQFNVTFLRERKRKKGWEGWRMVVKHETQRAYYHHQY